MRACTGKLTDERFAGIHLMGHFAINRHTMVIILGSRHTGRVIVVAW